MVAPGWVQWLKSGRPCHKPTIVKACNKQSKHVQTLIGSDSYDISELSWQNNIAQCEIDKLPERTHDSRSTSSQPNRISTSGHRQSYWMHGLHCPCGLHCQSCLTEQWHLEHQTWVGCRACLLTMLYPKVSALEQCIQYMLYFLTLSQLVLKKHVSRPSVACIPSMYKK